ncbi:hypothetical protein DFS33DRAFT_1465270 [Desarmillaria ectypa]|nr:hypothetical protein DFS33DRAFT_1465270 [Desarmillaria ectypa]
MSTFHTSVSCAAEWPTEINHLAGLLDSPIPSQLLRNILLYSSEQFTESTSEILDIFDLLFSTVGTLRALSDVLKDNAAQPTIPFWSLLIRSLAFICYDKSYTLEEAAFVRPRLSHVRSFMKDGNASLLISHIVQDIQRPRPILDDEASGRPSNITAERSNEGSQEEYDSEISCDDESSSYSDTSYERMEDSTDPTSAQSSYVPLDAHILTHWRHPNSVVLPYLCVTDREDIFSLMSSVLYQRSTWGIPEPVVGIILSKTGFVGRVVLGWLDEERADPDVLPAARFAYGDETRTDSSLGVYDLTDPVSALKFGQFIISLRAHVEGIVAQCQCQTPTFKRLSWRSDTIDDDNCGSEEQWEQRIVNWLSTVERWLVNGRSFFSESPSYRFFRTKTDGGSSNTGKTGKRSKSADALSCSAYVFFFDCIPTIDVHAGGISLGAKSLAGISPTAKLSFSSYAHDRKIISLTNIQLEADAKVANVSEINEMLEFYGEMTQYMKPPLNEASTFDKRVEQVRDHFLSQVDACSGSKNTPELPQHFWEVVLGSLSSLLWASVGGYSKELGGNLHNEAEARHEWDILLNLGFVETHELASGRVVLERALLLSRNVAADVMQTSLKPDGAEFKSVARQSRSIAFQHVQQLGDVNSKLLPLFDNAEAAKKAILKRAGDEPELGIVDAILALPLERLKNIEEPLIRVTETRATVQAARRALSPDNIAEPVENAVSEKPKVKRSRSARGGSRRTQSTTTQTELLAIVEEQEGHFRAPDGGGNKGGASDTQVVNNAELLHPFAVTCSETKPAPKMVFAPGVVMNVKELLTKLLLAVLVAEYKKPTQTYAKALVQAKMYLEASVRYLTSFGVTKQAIFALATDGVEGAIIMAWCSSDSESVYIVERNVRTFNVSSPIEVYHFVTVLLCLREYSDTTLKDAVKEALRADDFKQTSWNKTEQFNRMEQG